ncbi:MAG: HAMP domain-containing sensor histidine kinase [Acidobacteriota bacterium]|nr:HAMP domain-containing sensor histidine kinase [Acidobacteriota bacterium]
MDQQIFARMLDNARLLSRLAASRALDAAVLAEQVEAAGLDAAAWIGIDGRPLAVAGTPIEEEDLQAMAPLLAGEVDEMIFGAAVGPGNEHLGAAAADRGGIVFVRVHGESARTLVRRLGVGRLLAELVAEPGVLYLEYRVAGPRPLVAGVAWDGGPISPQPLPGGQGLRLVRGREVFEVDAPLDLIAGERGRLRVGLDGRRVQEAAAAAARRTILVALALVMFALATAGLVYVSRARALERADAARRLAEAELARRRSERLAAAGALTAGLAHEVRSPLNAISLAAQRIERRPPAGEGECAAFAARIRAEVARLDRVLREFLELARPVGRDREKLDLARLARGVVELLEPQATAKGVKLAEPEGTAVVEADAGAMRRALVNLLLNALEASPAGSQIETRVFRERDAVVMEVLDRGRGIDPADRERLFDAFVTTRADGSGLGLSLVRRVMDEHDGSCGLEPREGGGTRAWLRLPAGNQEEKA